LINRIKFDLREKRMIWKIVLYVCILFLPAATLISFFHEFGHVIMVLLLGGKVIQFKLIYFPFEWSFTNGYTAYTFGRLLLPFEEVLIAAAGSVFTLMIGIVFFIIFYRFRMHSFLETLFFMYCLGLGAESSVYAFFDLFILQSGDWYRVWSISPTMCIVFMAMFTACAIYFIKSWKKIEDHYDIDD